MLHSRLLEKLLRIIATKEQNGCDFALRSTGSSLPLLFLLKDALTAALFETQRKGLPAVRKKRVTSSRKCIESPLHRPAGQASEAAQKGPEGVVLLPFTVEFYQA